MKPFMDASGLKIFDFSRGTVEQLIEEDERQAKEDLEKRLATRTSIT